MNRIQRLPDRKAVVYTTKAKCRDCYRCVRVCPVHAIKMENGQAQVIAENCIACGTCITECPQHAKMYTTDYGKVLQMLEGNNNLIISLAPSFAAYYNEWEQKRLPSALRALGFHFVAETAAGAWHTAISTFQHINKNQNQNHICTTCPAVVNFINIYAPKYSKYLVPVASPMIAHAKLLKAEMPGYKFVFAGPCVAKKDEALSQNNANCIDAVLTFSELDELLNLKNIKLDTCEESSFDQKVNGDARLFPLEGGLLKTAGASTDIIDSHILSVSGFSEIKQVLQSIDKIKNETYIIEPLFCRYGCINGPVAKKEDNIFTKRQAIVHYSDKHPGNSSVSEDEASPRLHVDFKGSPLKEPHFSEEQIKDTLAIIGKLTPEDELNCMACGYDSCREKAIAVLEGLAEPEMCMPYMRKMSELKFATLIQHNPNGIVILNNNLEILHINEAFKKMFACSDTIIGKNLSYLIDPKSFEKLTTGETPIIRETVSHANYSITCHQICYAIPEQEQYVGIFMDVTAFQSNKEKLSDIKSETLSKAQELLDHQIGMAQELARFLGEHTAKEETLLNYLIELAKK